jgi:hypothetical protein
MFAAVFHALKDMGYRYGRYPYGTLTIVDPPPSATATAGMEYPTLIATQTRYLAVGPEEGPEHTTLHELAHQHFHGLLGSNEAEEPWLDEGFACYAAATVFAQRYGQVPQLTTFGGLPLHVRAPGMNRRELPLMALWRDAPLLTFVRGLAVPVAYAEDELWRAHAREDDLRRPAWRYSSAGSYAANAYQKPMRLLFTLEHLLGEDVMLRVLRTYAARHRYGHPTADDFRRALAEVADAAALRLWDEAVGGREVLDYAVDSLRSERSTRRGPVADTFESEVVVRRLGGLRAPVDVEVRFEGGGRVTERWDGEATGRRFGYTRPDRLAAARIDPAGRLALEWDVTNNARGLRRDHRPAARLGGKVLLWLQHLLAFAGGAA